MKIWYNGYNLLERRNNRKIIDKYMKVLPIVPRGYCKGVVRAINLAKKEGKTNNNVAILGMIVHNQFIVKALDQLGIKTFENPTLDRLALLEEVDCETLIITAHGASQEVFDNAQKKGFRVVDATCPDVIKTHHLIKEYLEKDYEILYIGKQNHPESQGSLSIDTNKVHLIEKSDDFNKLDKTKKYVITNQTTMSLFDVYHLCEDAKDYFEDVTIAKETCNATQVRQEAIANIENAVDVIFIVGDPHSNNTKKLASIAKEKTKKDVYMIEHVLEIEPSMLANKKYAAVSSGASTPTYLTHQVVEYLKQYDAKDASTHVLPSIDMSQIL